MTKVEKTPKGGNVERQRDREAGGRACLRTDLKRHIDVREADGGIRRRQYPRIPRHQFQNIDFRRPPPLLDVQPEVFRPIAGADELRFLLLPIANVVTPRP